MLSTGTLFNQHYRVMRCIRAGGMGAVYEVLDERTQRRRALKVMLPSLTADPELRSRFSLEITVAANVDSEHIVEVLDAGIDGETEAPFYVMELLKGEDLASALESRGCFSVEDTYVLLQQLSLALDRTHAQNIVHRDLKPGNLFITLRDDGSWRLKILDFGIAKVTTQASQDAKTTRSIGTPLYMSPEQVMGDGKIGPASDRYAMAQLAYTMLVGEAYFERDATQGTVYQVLMKVVAGLTESPSERARTNNARELPKAFDAWFQKATHRNAAERFGSSFEMMRGFAEVFGLEPPITERPAQRGSDVAAISASRVSHAELATTQRFVATPASPYNLAERPETLGRTRRWTLATVLLLAVLVPGAIYVFTAESRSASKTAESPVAPTTPPQPNMQPVTQQAREVVERAGDPPNVSPSATAPLTNTTRVAGPLPKRSATPRHTPKPQPQKQAAAVSATPPQIDPTDIR
jgi:serine/threonine-protein kinase